MDYIHRALERKFLKMDQAFKAVLVTGARQVGKTTLLKHLAEGSGRTYVSLDDAATLELARRDPKLFFQSHQPPILLDEVQKAPELFEQIKLICDESNETGLFWLTGSQQFNLISRVRESLAGRIAILELYSLSQREKSGLVFDDDLTITLDCLQSRQQLLPKNNVKEVFRQIWVGGMPQVLGMDEETRGEYFNSYINTYLLRDAAEEGGITDAVRFTRFLKCCAALTAELVNYATLAEAADISQPTAKRWLQLLQALGIIYLLQPYSNNALKRLVKTPKLYFCDTGLCAYLSMWLTPDALEAGAASGHFYENYVVMELVKSQSAAKRRLNFSFYRDSNAKEIDLLIEENGFIHPLEIKKSALPNVRLVQSFHVLDQTVAKRGTGGIICMADAPLPIDELNLLIPSNLI